MCQSHLINELFSLVVSMMLFVNFWPPLSWNKEKNNVSNLSGHSFLCIDTVSYTLSLYNSESPQNCEASVRKRGPPCLPERYSWEMNIFQFSSVWDLNGFLILLRLQIAKKFFGGNKVNFQTFLMPLDARQGRACFSWWPQRQTDERTSFWQSHYPQNASYPNFRCHI